MGRAKNWLKHTIRAIAFAWLASYAAFAIDTDPPEVKQTVIILHKGDPIPANGVLYSYDSEATEKDFERRRKERDEEREMERLKKEQI